MDRRALLGLGLFSVLALPIAGCSRATTSPGGHSTEDLKTLTVDEVAARVAAHDGKTFVFDNNSKDRYRESHVPSATWVSFNHVTAKDLPSDKTAALVFYCANSF
jgi:hypothetical protein